MLYYVLRHYNDNVIRMLNCFSLHFSELTKVQRQPSDPQPSDPQSSDPQSSEPQSSEPQPSTSGYVKPTSGMYIDITSNRYDMSIPHLRTFLGSKTRLYRICAHYKVLTTYFFFQTNQKTMTATAAATFHCRLTLMLYPML